jgi:hypothetical protein
MNSIKFFFLFTCLLDSPKANYEKTQAKILDTNKHMHIAKDKGHNKATWTITKIQ